MFHHTPSPTLMERFRSRLAGRVADQRGLALLDVLIGMAIFALIAVIAVVALGQFRQDAFKTAAVEDARSLGLAVESSSTDTGEYPTNNELVASDDEPVEITFADVDNFKHPLTKNNDLYDYEYVPGTDTTPASFFLCVEHKSNGKADAAAFYDSAKGGIVASSENEGCADVTPAGYTFTS